MSTPARELIKVKDVPEVKAAMEALDQAVEASRQAYRAWRDADLLVDQRQGELAEAAADALASQKGREHG